MTETHKLDDGPCAQCLWQLDKPCEAHKSAGHGHCGCIRDLEAKLAAEHETALNWHRDNMELAAKLEAAEARLREAEAGAAGMREALIAAGKALDRLLIWCSQEPTGPVEAHDVAKWVNQQLHAGLLPVKEALASSAGRAPLERVERLEKALMRIAAYNMEATKEAMDYLKKLAENALAGGE